MQVKANTPIIDSDGNVIALWSGGSFHGDRFSWTWFNPATDAALIRGPKFEDDERTIPTNRGTLFVEYQRGGFVVLGCDLSGDTEHAFDARYFTKPDEPVCESWGGKLSAVKVLREYLSDPMTSTQLDRLEEMFAYYAKNETRGENG